MKNISKIAIPSLLILSAVSFSGIVNAEDVSILPATDKQKMVAEDRQNLREERQQIKEEIKTQRQENLDAKCKLTTDKIDQRIANYNKNQSVHQGIYHNIQVRLTNLISRGEAAGYDVSKLKTDLEELNKKVKVFQDAYAAFIAKLGETKDHTCGSSQGEFVNALQTARAELLKVREAIQDIRSFYESTIRPDVLALKAQKPVRSPTPVND